MKRIREKHMEVYLENMQQYFEKVQKMSKEEAHQLLVRDGALDENGNPKEQICNVGMC